MNIRKLKKNLSPIDRMKVTHFKGWLRTYKNSKFPSIDKHFINFYKKEFRKMCIFAPSN